MMPNDKRSKLNCWRSQRLVVALLTLSALALPAEETKPAQNQRPPIAIAEMKRTAPIDFEQEVLPILKNNCLACHNQTKAKADLILETPQTILKGGESGPAVVPGKSAESLLLRVASHQEKPLMPPKDNKVAALDLTPEELGLIRSWIDQGAKGEVRADAPIHWRALPEGLNPIFAVALTADGQFAACGRANQIFIYHLPSGQLATRLTDPQLLKENGDHRHGAAHRDMVHALAFSPDGNLLASGGYREIKVWRRPRNVQKFNLAGSARDGVRTVAVSPDGNWLASGGGDGAIKLFELASGKEAKTLAGHEQAVTSLKFSPDSVKLLSGSTDKSLRVWTIAEGSVFAQTNTPAEVDAVTWAAGAKQIACAGADSVIRLWQLPESANGALALVRELKGHEGVVTSLDTVAPDGKQIISGGMDGSLRLWRLETGEMLRQMKHGGPVAAVAARPDGKRFVSAGLNNLAKLWDADAGDQLAEIKGDRYAQEFVVEAERTAVFQTNEVAYQKTVLETTEKQRKTTDERLAKAKEAATAAEKVFGEKQKAAGTAAEAKIAAEKALAEIIAELKRITDEFQAADKSAKQTAAEAKTAMEKATQARVVADQAAQTRLESEKIAADATAVAARTKAAVENAPGDAAKAAAAKIAEDAAAVAQQAQKFAESIAADAAVKSKLAAEARAAAERAIDEVAAKSFATGQLKPAFDKVTAEAPEKQKQATEKLAAATNALLAAQNELKKADQAKSNSDTELQLAQNAATQAADATTAAASALQNAENEYRKATAALEAAKRAATESESPIRAVAFSPDNLTLATGGDDQVIHTWSAETGQSFETYKGHTGTVFAVAFLNPSSIASGSADLQALVWDFNPVWTLERIIGTGEAGSPLVDRVNVLRFSPDGQLLASGSGEPTRSSDLKIWRVSDGNLAHAFTNVHSDTVLALDFSADGKYLASGGADKFVKVLELASGKVAKSFEGHTHHVLGVSWKRDGRTLASSGADNVVKVWDFVTGEKKKNIEGFSKEVTSIAFVGATDQALASSGDTQVRLLRENGDNVRSFSGAADYLYSAAATPDGRIVIAGGQDSTLRVWNGVDGKGIANFTPPAAK